MMRCKRKYLHLLTLVIVFLLIYPGNLDAKKMGSLLVVEKQDGQVIEGELLSVKENSLLVLTSGSGNGVTIDINGIEKIKIKRKKKFGKGALIGAGVGFLIGMIGGSIDSNHHNESEGPGIGDGFHMGGIVGVTFAIPGALIGGIGATISGDYKTIQLKGKSPSEIEKIMEKLKKKARFKT